MQPEQTHHSPRFGGVRSVISTIFLFLLAPAIALLIAAFVVQSYQVDGQSMEPTLQDNDRLIVNKWSRSWARFTTSDYIPQRGDIIIFNQLGVGNSGGTSKQLIKRVIGLPGERVVVDGGKLTVYNQANPQGFDPDASSKFDIIGGGAPGNSDYTLADNEVFVCGDNRANSEDSRSFGPVDAQQIVGTLSLRIVPLDKAQRF